MRGKQGALWRPAAEARGRRFCGEGLPGSGKPLQKGLEDCKDVKNNKRTPHTHTQLKHTLSIGDFQSHYTLMKPHCPLCGLSFT